MAASKPYIKRHRVKKAADAHQKKIKKRGGKVARKGNQLSYYFPGKK